MGKNLLIAILLMTATFVFASDEVQPENTEVVTDSSSQQMAATSEVQTNSLATTLEDRTLNMNRKLGVSVLITTSRSVLEEKSYNDYLTTTAQVNLSYKLNDKLRLQASGAADKNLKGERDQSFSAAYIGLSAPIKNFGTSIATSATARYYFPVNADQRRETTFNGRALGRLSADFNLAKYGLKYVSVNLMTSFSKNFHEYKRTASNGANTSFYTTNILTLSYMPFLKGGFSFYFSNTTKWDYENERGSDSFALGQSFDWQLDNQFAISVGHELGGKTYGYSGSQLDVSLFDKNKSSIYTSLIYTL